MSHTSTSVLIEEGADLIARSFQAGWDSLRDICTMRSCGCDIPPPCWYPKAAGDVTSFGCPGGTAVLRVRVQNCGPAAKHVRLEASGDEQFEPSAFVLGSMEHKVARIRVDVPDKVGDDKELLLWIRGYHAHYVRWRIVAARRACDTCHELDVEDAPDYVHHWYDHFYCERPYHEPRRADAAG